jgi:tRNA (guanine37-N1)-methyltransferase
MMRIDILTLFPGMFAGPLTESIVKRAQAKGLVEIHLTDMRDFAHDKHRTADDRPFGGGVGMVLRPAVVYDAVQSIPREAQAKILLTSPQGRVFDQKYAIELSEEAQLIFICGHYEGIDERIRDLVVTEEVSIGDYVLTGGELPAMVMVDSIIRLLPGVLGKAESPLEDSFYEGLLDYPHYTRPEEFQGLSVPSVLLSGNHAEIARWRRKQSLYRTMVRRPDLLEKAPLSAEDRRWLAEFDPAFARSYN